PWVGRHPGVARLLGAAPPRPDAGSLMARAAPSGPAAGRLLRALGSVVLVGGLTVWIAFQASSLGGVVGVLGAVAAIGLFLSQFGFIGLVTPSVLALGVGYVLADTSGNHLAVWTAIPYGIGAFLAAELAAWAGERHVNMAVEGRGSDLARWSHLGTVAVVAAAIGGALLAATGTVHSGGLALEAAGLVAAVGLVAVVVVLTARARSSASS
ncbi:MAG: hypothetical protein J2P59_05245, partial [Acidimicrobiales bacterium]|nr:hypothetical protein [Acidimicrobiales bacterium]